MSRDFKDPSFRGLFTNGKFIFKTGEAILAASSCAWNFTGKAKNAIELLVRAAATDDLRTALNQIPGRVSNGIA
jgi:hypothetical protein